MNIRIKELMLEAGYAAPELASRANKLVELIVNECVGIVGKLPPGYKDYRDQIEDAFRRDCIATMREHFGVSE